MKKCACKGSFLDKLLQPTILMLLSQQRLHGFSILKKMEESKIMDYSGVDPTGLYRTLKKMETTGLLTSEWDMKDSSQPRRIYEITADGRDCLEHWKTTLIEYKNSIDNLIDAISAVSDGKE
ncbi:MAG: PadR family transcriptional regulator [Christensenellales bacterium]